jgi:hypothetical protein
VKLLDALDQILGEGRTAAIAARGGAEEALAAGLAAVEIAGCSGPAASAIAAFAKSRLRDREPALDARHVLATEIGVRRPPAGAPSCRRTRAIHGPSREAMTRFVAAS